MKIVIIYDAFINCIKNCVRGEFIQNYLRLLVFSYFGIIIWDSMLVDQ